MSVHREILRVRNLTVAYEVGNQMFTAVNAVDLDIRAGEIFGLVGESGSGKSTMSMAILGNLPKQAWVSAASVNFMGTDLTALLPEQWRTLRWRQLAYIPQGAMNALNPVRTIEDQFLDLIRDHEGPTRRSTQRQRLSDSLESMGLSPDVLDKFPHQLSGGMKQRVCIVMSTIFQPQLIIADEPTSALDVISQRVVLGTLMEARDRIGSAVILIGHDLALQAQVADRIGIMNAGRIVEFGPVVSVFQNPVHPYTRKLIRSVPSIRHQQDIDDFLGADEQEETVVYPSGPIVEVAPGHFAMQSEEAK